MSAQCPCAKRNSTFARLRLPSDNVKEFARKPKAYNNGHRQTGQFSGFLGRLKNKFVISRSEVRILQPAPINMSAHAKMSAGETAVGWHDENDQDRAAGSRARALVCAHDAPCSNRPAATVAETTPIGLRSRQSKHSGMRERPAVLQQRVRGAGSRFDPGHRRLRHPLLQPVQRMPQAAWLRRAHHQLQLSAPSSDYDPPAVTSSSCDLSSSGARYWMTDLCLSSLS